MWSLKRVALILAELSQDPYFIVSITISWFINKKWRALSPYWYPSIYVSYALLYACETWTVYSRHARKLNHFHTTRLRKVLNIRWQDRVPDTEVLERENLPSVHILLQKSQVRWAGHVYRMPDDRIPKQLFYGELSTGKRTVGGQRKRFKDNLKLSLKSLNIDWENWDHYAIDRPYWRKLLISVGAKASEETRLRTAKDEPTIRTIRSASTSTTETDHRCPTCDCYFLALTGLVGHLRTHRIQSTE